MKKLLKSVSAILISIVYFLCSGNVVHGEASNILNDYFKNGEWKYLLTSNNYQYKQLSNAIRSSAADQYMLSIIDFYISTGAEPDKRKYEEVLMNIIMTSEYDSSEKISEQYKMDKMKSGKEYLMDAKDAVNSAIQIYSGIHSTDNEWEEALTTAIDGLSTLTDNTDNLLDALCDLETILYNYGKLDKLLNYIYENSSGELKKAAQELNSGMKSLMCIKLEMYNDVSNKNFQNYTELLFTDSFIKAVKLSDEYANDENLKFFVDKADGLFEVLDVMKNSWNLGVIIGKTIGNITVGGENIIRRVHEIEALSDIEDVLSNKILEEQNVLLGNQTIENLQNYVYDCNILTGTHIRGEYCVYSIIAKDAGWLSLLNFSKAEDAKQWYDLKTERILKISSNLENLLNDFKSEEMKDYEWQLKPTIEADNIIVPDYNDELFEKYAIIEKGGKYGLISNEGVVEIECKYNGYSICSLENTYIMAKKIENDYISESDDYILVDSKLIESRHGGHDSYFLDYVYDNSLKKTYSMSLGDVTEYTGKKAFPAQEGLHKNKNREYYDELGKWGITSGNKIIKDFEYENGRYTNTLIALEKNKLWGYFDQNGKEIIPFIAKRSDYINNEEFIVSTYKHDYMAFMDVNGIVAVNTDDGGCFYDVSGNQLTDPSEFEEVRPMINNFAWVKKDGKWGVIKLNAFETNDDWKKAYTDYIKNIVEKNSNIYEKGEFIFVDIDSNDIPEIFYDSGSGYGGSGVIIYNGNVKELHMGNSSGIRYIKGKNLFVYSGGHMDNYYDKLYCIDNGEFSLSDDGEYGMLDNSNIQSISDYEYYWNGIQVSKDEYENSLNNAFDVKKAINPFDDTMYNYEEFLEVIRNYNISEAPFDSNAELTKDENSKKETGIVKIDDGYLNVRESPSIDGKIISKLYNGDEVIINGTSDDGKWIEVSKESIKGYVSKDFIVKN